MKLAYDAKRLFHNRTGLGNYSRTLVKNLSHHFPSNQLNLLATKTTNSQFIQEFQSHNIIDTNPLSATCWRSFSISKDVNKLQPDIYHGLSNELPFTSHKIKAKKIVTIHDLFYLKFPNDFSLFDRNIYRYKTEFACRNADHIIAISDSTKQDLVSLLGVKPDKITTVYQSCHSIFQNISKSTIENSIKCLNNKELPHDFSLFVGTLNERKNILGLIKALNDIPSSIRIPLVIVGNGKVKFIDKLKRYISENKLETYIYFLGIVPNQHLISLYRNARFTCLPSYYEGFGIPIIESLFCNTPVLVGENSGQIEAIGACGAFIDPYSTENMSATLQKMICDNNFIEDCKRNIPNHIDKFTELSTAKSMNTAYRDVLSD